MFPQYHTSIIGSSVFFINHDIPRSKAPAKIRGDAAGAAGNLEIEAATIPYHVLWHVDLFTGCTCKPRGSPLFSIHLLTFNDQLSAIKSRTISARRRLLFRFPLLRFPRGSFSGDSSRRGVTPRFCISEFNVERASFHSPCFFHRVLRVTLRYNIKVARARRRNGNASLLSPGELIRQSADVSWKETRRRESGTLRGENIPRLICIPMCPLNISFRAPIHLHPVVTYRPTPGLCLRSPSGEPHESPTFSGTTVIQRVFGVSPRDPSDFHRELANRRINTAWRIFGTP